MKTFTLTRAGSVEDASRAGGGTNGAVPAARFIAGGTTLVDLMKLDVERPDRVIDINHLPLAAVERLPEGGLRAGALVRNATLAAHPDVKRDYPVLADALMAGASAQLRNMATTGGNVLQRTRCGYFRDAASACNKREPGSGCPAIGGANRMLAIFGTSDACIATNPSDMNVALAALDAVIDISGTDGARSIPFDEFFLLPGHTPERETVLRPGDLITSVSLPPPAPGTRSVYLKLRDRASYEFALVSVAVVLTMNGENIDRIRIALGGVGTKPWRARAAEEHLAGGAATIDRFRAAADAVVADARPQSENGFKVELARRAIVHALSMTVAQGGTPA